MPAVHLDADLIPLSQGALEARLNRERLLRLVQAGRIAGQQIAGRWLISRASLDHYLAERAVA